VQLDPFNLDAHLLLPRQPRAAVLIVDGSGASTRRPELRAWAATFAEHDFAVLIADLLTGEEQPRGSLRRDRPDVAFMAGRLVVAADYLSELLRHEASAAGRTDAASEPRAPGPAGQTPPIYLVTTGSAAAAALFAETERSSEIHGVITWSGRPAMAGAVLPIVRRPVLFIAPRDAPSVIEECTRAANFIGPSATVTVLDRRVADAEIPALALAWMKQIVAPADATSTNQLPADPAHT
jgi:hypothetical protein